MNLVSRNIFRDEFYSTKLKESESVHMETPNYGYNLCIHH